jgi:hypothetical protein
MFSKLKTVAVPVAATLAVLFIMGKVAAAKPIKAAILG